MSQPEHASQTPRIALALGVVATWVSLWLSTIPLPIDDARVRQYLDQGGSVPLSGRGGWPLPAFKYPVSPLGGDIPNADAAFPFLLNLLFWVAVCALILWPLPSRFFRPAVERGAIGLAALLTIFGVFFLLIKFD